MNYDFVCSWGGRAMQGRGGEGIKALSPNLPLEIRA